MNSQPHITKNLLPGILLAIITLGYISLGFIALAPLQLAQADDDYIEARRLQVSGEILPLEAILKNIRLTFPDKIFSGKIFPGKILEVELEKENGKIVYEVEILGEDGVVREIYINAKTGKLISVKEDD